MASLNWKWINPSPGILVLHGTPFRVELKGDDSSEPPKWHLYWDDRLVRVTSHLGQAQGSAYDYAQDLLKAGLVDDEAVA